MGSHLALGLVATVFALALGCGGGGGPPVILFHRGGDTGPASVPSRCATGGSASPEDAQCGSDDDCVLTNWLGHCGHCYCPFGHYAINREALERARQVDPDAPLPACPRIPPSQCQACGVCYPYDETHRPTRAVCREGLCEPDPPPPPRAVELPKGTFSSSMLPTSHPDLHKR